jgi:hypothetical protein
MLGAREFAADNQSFKIATPATNQGAHRPPNCMWLSTFQTHMTALRNYAHSKQQSTEITKMQMF